jgi:hypothetical protein
LSSICRVKIENEMKMDFNRKSQRNSPTLSNLKINNEF